MAARITFHVVLVLSVLVALASFRFVGLGLELSFPDFGAHIAERRVPFVAHVTLASVALAICGLQLLPKLRAQQPGFHRWTGRLYAVCVLFGALSGFWIAFYSPGGAVATVGFATLSVAWLSTTGIGIFNARRKAFAAHREWMIRSIALTLAGLTLRLYLGVILLTGGGYVAASPYLAWLCWVPNVLIAEWWLRRAQTGARPHRA